LSRGPIGKSREEKELAGNPGNRPLPKEFKLRKGAPQPPADLRGEAFAEWCRIVPELEAAGLLAHVDRSYLVIYCSAWAQHEDAREALDREGVLVDGQKGNLVKNPAAQVMKDAADIMLKYGAKLGLNPSDRARLGAAMAGDNDEDGPDADVRKLFAV
jgi:P27 family predicted phage terminase small subunit